MLARLLRLVLVRQAGGPTRAALYLGALSVARRALHSKELVIAEPVRPGERLLVEHLTISHRRQVKQLKREEQRARRRHKRERRAQRRSARKPARSTAS